MERTKERNVLSHNGEEIFLPREAREGWLAGGKRGARGGGRVCGSCWLWQVRYWATLQPTSRARSSAEGRSENVDARGSARSSLTELNVKFFQARSIATAARKANIATAVSFAQRPVRSNGHEDTFSHIHSLSRSLCRLLQVLQGLRLRGIRKMSQVKLHFEPMELLIKDETALAIFHFLPREKVRADPPWGVGWTASFSLLFSMGNLYATSWGGPAFANDFFCLHFRSSSTSS